MTDEIDRIEREIAIDAPIDRVWQLVSEPGWWIGDGDRSSQVVTREGDLVIVDDPKYGRYPVRPVTADAPRYASFRSTAEADGEPTEHNSTLVEFFLNETDGRTVLRVVESGFASLDMPADAIDDTIEGWKFQLGVAKREAERN
jgi:uncharacterized protein YndB with AHSA1/START domain